MAQQGTRLIIGGTGKTGRRVAQRLSTLGIPIRVATRSSHPGFDWEDPSSWAPALEGTSAAYLAYSPDLAVLGAAEVVGRLARLATRLGVERLVLLSGRGEEGARLGEQAVQASAAEWTILRCSWFDQNFSEGVFLEPVREGMVALPAGDVREPFLDVDDVAEVAAAALTAPGHAGQVYELAGPRLLTFAEAVGEIARATGRRIRYQRVAVEAYTAALAGMDLPAPHVSLAAYLFTEVLDGRNASLADGVQRALGRPARDFAAYAQAAAATGVWNP